MALIKVGSSVINTEYIAHVDLDTYGQKSGDVILYLKGSEGDIFAGGLEADENYRKLEIKELRFSGEEAEALKRYFSNYKNDVSALQSHSSSLQFPYFNPLK